MIRLPPEEVVEIIAARVIALEAKYAAAVAAKYGTSDGCEIGHIHNALIAARNDLEGVTLELREGAP